MTTHSRKKVVGREELIRNVAQTVGTSQKEADAIFSAALVAIREALGSGAEVRLIDFGTFRVTTSAARKGINPRDRTPMNIPARDRVRFSPGKKLSEAVARP